MRSFKGRHPDRFVTFANLDFRGIDDPEWGARAAAQLEHDVRVVGLSVKDGSGRRVPTDDPRLAPVWAAAARLGIPVLIHTAEPASFFEPIDEHNERWLELNLHPSRRTSRRRSWRLSRRA